MAWTARLISVVKESGNVVAHCTLTDGNETMTYDIPGEDLSIESLGKFLGQIVDSKNKRDASFDTLKPQEGNEITLIMPGV